MKKYKVETHPNVIKEGYDKEEFEWSVDEILEEINRDRSSEWIDYDETDFAEGWREWCEGTYYTIKELLIGVDADIHNHPLGTGFAQKDRKENK